MPCGWEGNRGSGVALATSHRLQWFIRQRDHGLRKGYEHPAYTPRAGQHSSLDLLADCGSDYFSVRGRAPLVPERLVRSPGGLVHDCRRTTYTLGT